MTQTQHNIFCRNLLTLYTWTGQSRKETSKQQFNKLTNILNLFYEVICYADSSFSHKLKDEFFRDGVLKHSIERSQPKKVREKKIKMKSSVCLNTATNNIHNNDTNKENGAATENTSKAAESLTPVDAECNFNDNNTSECEDNDYSSSSQESIVNRVAIEYRHDQDDEKLAAQ